MAAILRGTFVEAEQPTVVSSPGFCLEEATVVEWDPEGPADLQTTAINLDMPSAMSPESWVGQEVVVEGRLDAPPEEESSRQVFVVEHIDEA